MDSPGTDRRPITRVRLVTAVVAVVATSVVVGLAIRAAGEPAARADPPPPVGEQARSATLPDRSPSPSSPKTPLLAPAQDVLVLGDSLALSTYPWLADLLPDRFVSWDAVVGRSTRQARLALEARAAAGDVPPVIVVSSGTNDLDARSLRTEAAQILAIAGPARCVVWADVVRPDAFGDGMAAANAALTEALTGHPNVVPVAWTTLVAAHPGWLSGDGIHPRQEGSRARAEAFAAAVLSCSPLDPDATVHSKEYLPPSAFLSPGGHSVPGVGPSASTPAPASSSPRAEASGPPSASGSASASPSASSEPTPSAQPSDSPSEPPTQTASPGATPTGQP